MIFVITEYILDISKPMNFYNAEASKPQRLESKNANMRYAPFTTLTGEMQPENTSEIQI